MPHTALYRKKRPHTFVDVVGQKHIVRVLHNQLLSNQISHAYLFCGTRGTGKTSVSRIFARAINCTSLQEGNPCNTCESCLSILAERNIDVVEVDAASNNSVENIRDLRNDVTHAPINGKYKVYIIDEVHMLSTSAFNALLKTLEEPPPHVIFILATTDQQKLPATILSRCQRYDFRRISAVDMIAALKKHLSDEGIEYEEKALEYIAYHSDGAMRDALSLLDQSLSTDESKLYYSQVLEMLGAVDRAHLFDFTAALSVSDSTKVMQIITQAMTGGRDASQFVADLIRHFRDVLVASLVSDAGGVDFSVEMAEKLREQGSAISSDKLMEYVHVFSEALREMRFAPHARTAFEVAALKICSPRKVMVEVVSDLPTSAPVVAPVQNAHPPQNKAVPHQAGTALAEITPQILESIATGWDELCERFPNPMRSRCLQCAIEINDGKLDVIMNNETMRNLLKPKELTIREAIAERYRLATPPNIFFVVKEDFVKPKSEKKAIPRVGQLAHSNYEQQALLVPDDWAQDPPSIPDRVYDEQIPAPDDWAQASQVEQDAPPFEAESPMPWDDPEASVGAQVSAQAADDWGSLGDEVDV